MKLFVVLPFSKDYESPITQLLKSFTTYDDAMEYANEWDCVELITTPLNG